VKGRFHFAPDRLRNFRLIQLSSSWLGAAVEREAPRNLSAWERTNLSKLIEEELTPLLRGWMNYFRLAEVNGIPDDSGSR
jgi:hypothetical protein